MPNIKPLPLTDRKEVSEKARSMWKQGLAHSAKFWKLYEQELDIYNNENPHDIDSGFGGKVEPIVRGESIYNKTAEIIDAVHPRLDQGMPRAVYVPDVTEDDDRFENNKFLVDQLGNWVKMYEGVDSEVDLHRVSSLHVLNQGITIRKIVWDKHDDRLTCPVISPLTFVVDSGCTQVNLSDARFCGQVDRQMKLDVSVNYPDYEIVGNPDDEVDLAEMWVRGWVAKHYLGIDTELDIIKLVFVDSELLEAWPSPWNYPDFPYSAWRCFDAVDKSKKPVHFWGIGYPKKLWRQQKLLDEVLANILIMIGNQASGMMVTTYGAFKNPSILRRIHGAIIELAKGKTLRDVQELPPVQVSREAMELVQFTVGIMESITGISGVFTGEAPEQALSGRAISSLQAQAFSQISNLIRGMVEHRRRLARMKASAVQQYAQRPVKPNQWRGGIDVKSDFPEDARHVGFEEQIHDTSLLPQTAAGRLELGQILSQFGLTIEKFLELTGIDKVYGLTPQDFAAGVPIPVAPGGPNQPNEGVLAGVERQAA